MSKAAAVTAVPSSSTPVPPPVSSSNPPTGIDAGTNAAQTVHFVGEVKQGETFVKAVAPNLVFRLSPNAEGDSGWRIEILPDTKPLPQDLDCSGSVTPPAHGSNDLFLDQPDGMSPAKVPQWNPHQFNFVADASQCKLAWDLNNETNYPSNLTDEEREAADAKLGKIPTGTGTLTVLDSHLGPATGDDQYGPILWLKFEVTLQFPQPTSAQAK